MIETTLETTAAPATVHRLLTEIEAWGVWSPHVASVDPPHGSVRAGETIATRAFFSPTATPMHVDRVDPDRGMAWHSRAFGLTLRYENAVEPAARGRGARLRWTARLEGPGAAVLERLVAPLSALGQRRRMARLARLAELVERQPG